MKQSKKKREIDKYKKYHKRKEFKILEKNRNISLARALEHYNAGEYNEAIKILENAPGYEKTDKSYNTLANCYSKLKNTAKAKENYQKSLNENSLNMLSTIALYNILVFKERDKKSAENLLMKFLLKDPCNIRVMKTLGEFHLKFGQLATAVDLFRECTKICPEDAEARLNLGKTYLKLKMQGNAEGAFKECLVLEPENVQAMYELGKLYALQGIEQEAEKYYKERLRILPNDTLARVGIGKMYLSRGADDYAEKIFHECLDLNPNDANAKLELGRLRLKQGRKEEARTLFQERLNENPQDALSRIELARLYAEEGNETKAQELYDYVYKNSNIRSINEYGEKERKKHIERHLKNDLSKEKHGVFNLSIEKIKEKIDFSKVKRQHSRLADIYCFKIENCGYEGGYNGDGHRLDFLTIATFPGKLDIITMFPSDEVIIDKGKKIAKQQLEEIEEYERE